MCGIAGIFSYHRDAPIVDRIELDAMRDRMRNRGPDGFGSWFSPNGRLGLGHRRLSIIDPSAEGAQPMASCDGSYVVAYNGEIYNYQALREELARTGSTFRSHSDTEVLLELYRKLGEDMFSRLRGMFAFALWDAHRGALLLGRDPFGIKPLYYADDGRCLRLASQVKALRAGGRVSRALDPAGKVGFLLFGSVPEPYSIHQQIRALPAGSFAWVDEQGLALSRRSFSVAQVFHEAAAGSVTPDGDEALLATVQSALADSVWHHQVADVPVGAFLSSGIDSAALVGLMCRREPQDVRTVTITFPEFRGRPMDEAPLAKDVAQRYGASHEIRVVDEGEFRRDLPAIIEAMDQPTIDGINTWFASKAARELGLKVAISGLGGDELFGGYPSFRQVPLLAAAMGPLAKVPGLGRWTRRLAAPLASRTPLSPKLAGLIELGGSMAGAYLLRRGLFMPWELERFMDADEARFGLSELDPLRHIEATLRPDPGSDYGRVAAMETSLYMRNQLLRDTDWASMGHGLEVRTPLVDVELVRALVPALLARRGVGAKPLLGQSPVPPLPRAVLDRPKTGFGTPIVHWLQRAQRLGGPLDGWRRQPTLARFPGHASRRLAYALLCLMTD